MSSPSARPCLEVPNHPLPARDATEAATFQRDLAIASLFDYAPNETKVWLASRARARRDLLWLCRHVLGLDRLSEEIHRAPADECMKIMTTPHGFWNNRDPRGNGKSSLTTRGGPLWCLIQDPIECITRGWPIRGRESRLGISTLKLEMTKELMLVTMGDLESPDLRWLFPELVPDVPEKWSSVEGVILHRGFKGDLKPLAVHPHFASYPRLTRFTDPTIAARALESGVAGPHSQGEFIDDPVNSKTWNSETNIKNAIHGIRQLFSVTRTEQGFRIVIGNHWCPGDVADTLDLEGARWKVFMRSATACAECKDGYPVDDRGLVPRRPDGQWSHQHSEPKFVHLMPESDLKPIDFTGLARIYAGCETKHIALSQYENSPLAAEATMWSSRSLPRFHIAEHNPLRPPNASDMIEYLDPKGTPTRERIHRLPVSITFDPSHGSLNTNASENACVVVARTPFDQLAALESWTSKPTRNIDDLEALDHLVETIYRYRKARLRIGVESVGFQRVIKSLLLRELKADRIPCCFVRPEEACRKWCQHRLDAPLIRSAGIPEDAIIPIPRTKAEGEKEGYIRESLSPLIADRSLLLGTNTPGNEQLALSLDIFPIRITDLADALAMQTHLLVGRAPETGKERTRLRRLSRLRREERKRSQGPAGYGRWI